MRARDLICTVNVEPTGKAGRKFTPGTC